MAPAPERYRFFGGKGGVGKTTCAAAAAIASADAGRRVLVVSTDPAHSLGDALDVRLGAAARRVRGTRGDLYAAELDADRALLRWFARRRPTLRLIAGRGTYLDDEDIDRFLRLSLPGVDELMGLLELTRLAGTRRYDEVVVDTAPTGHTLRLLEMPETLRRLAAVLDDMQAKHRFLAESLRGTHHRDVADALVEEVDTDGRVLAELVRDPERSRFTWVMLPERLSLEETRDGVRALADAGIAVADIVVNRVTPLPDAPCALCDARTRAERAVIAEIRTAFPALGVRALVDADVEPRGIAALRPIGRSLARGGDPLPRLRRRAPGRPARATSVAHEGSAWIDVLAPRCVRLLLFGGKGGVGKTTCAAVAALALARRDRDRRVLLLSTDPAHSLADVLATEIGDVEREIPGAPGNLRARELDADRAWAERRDRYVKAVDDVFSGIMRGTAFDATFDRAVVRELIDLAPPGLDEVFGVLGVVAALIRPDHRYDAVVVDTAPTGHALRLLRMPGAALEWVRALLAILLKYRAVIGLGDFAADLVEVSRELRELEALLVNAAETRFVTVTRAAALPRAETVRLLRELRRLRIAAPVVIVNGLRPPACARCARRARVEVREVAMLAAACRRVGGRPRTLVRTPLVAPPPTGADALTAWSAAFAVEQPA